GGWRIRPDSFLSGCMRPRYQVTALRVGSDAPSTDPSPVPLRLVKAPAAGHPLPKGEGCHPRSSPLGERAVVFLLLTSYFLLAPGFLVLRSSLVTCHSSLSCGCYLAAQRQARSVDSVSVTKMGMMTLPSGRPPRTTAIPPLTRVL